MTTKSAVGTSSTTTVPLRDRQVGWAGGHGSNFNEQAQTGHEAQGALFAAPKLDPRGPRTGQRADFADPELAVPYGVYEVGANTGWLNVGTDANTGQFAVESIRRWWHHVGRHGYPDADGC